MTDRIRRKMESNYQFVINITLSEDLRKDNKQVNSGNYPFYDSGKKFRLLKVICRCYGDHSFT